MNCIFETCTEAVDHAAKDKGFGVFCSQEKNPNQEVHIHECCEVFLCLEGGKSFLIDNRIYDINDGDLFVINQFEAHKVVPDKREKFSRYILHVHPEFLYSNSFGSVNLSDCFYLPGKLTKTALTPDELQKFISLFESLKQTQSYGDDMFKRLRTTEILLETSRAFATHQSEVPGELNHKTVRLAIDYINENYSGELSVESVARNAYISPAHLSRLFNKYCGTTVTKYIISKRITEAKKLLLEGKSVTDTAFLCGFNDYANFIRAFKRVVGVPPGKYKISRSL